MNYLINLLYITSVKYLNVLISILHFQQKPISSKRVLELNFPKYSDFTFIQVGANDGISFDFLYDFVTTRNSKGLVIEPIKEYYDELLANYKNFPEIKKVNKAVHPTEKSVVLNRISALSFHKYPDWVKGIASIDSEHHKRTGIIDTNDIVQEVVNADSLMNIINENFNNVEINYFQVDTEGFDYEVIKMLDFNQIRPDIIKYEYVNLKEEEQKVLKNLLKTNGYSVFNEFSDTIAVDKNLRLF